MDIAEQLPAILEDGQPHRFDCGSYAGIEYHATVQLVRPWAVLAAWQKPWYTVIVKGGFRQNNCTPVYSVPDVLETIGKSVKTLVEHEKLWQANYHKMFAALVPAKAGPEANAAMTGFVASKLEGTHTAADSSV